MCLKTDQDIFFIKCRMRGLVIRYGESHQNSNNIDSTDFFFNSKIFVP